MIDSDNPSIKGYNSWRRNTVLVVFYFLVILGILALIVMLYPSLAECSNKKLAKLSLVCCGILPPLWFWFEYNYIWWRAPEDKRPKFNEFKYGHDLARNLWLSFYAVLLILYFYKS